MKTRIHFLRFLYHVTVLFLLVVTVSCVRHTPVSANGRDLFSATCITPRTFRSGETLPIIIRIDDVSPDSLSSTGENYTLAISGGTPSNCTVILKKGVGGTTGTFESGASVTISSDDLNVSRTVGLITDQIRTHHSGALTNSVEIWDTTTDHVITGNLEIPAGTELIIREGSRVLSGDKCNIIVNGTVRCEGSVERPILFSSFDRSQPWGGIEITGGTGRFAYCIFTNGGADQARTFGHADCQPVIHAVRSSLTVSDCFFVDNAGKALGAVESTVSIRNSLMTRCVTGGEFHSSVVDISRCHIIDIPSGDGLFIDNDNDGFYFLNRHPDNPEASRVSRCFFITGKDDAIDHNNARLSVEHCWLEDFLHEGLAASGGDTVSVYNTVIRGCEQGVEAGYGAPHVTVDHCVIVETGVGLRFGDSYETPASGRLTATNTILFSNTDDIHVFDISNDSPVDSVIHVSYCLFNDSEYNASPFCISGTPLFDAGYHLLEQSAGTSSGSDDGPLGLLKE